VTTAASSTIAPTRRPRLVDKLPRTVRGVLASSSGRIGLVLVLLVVLLAIIGPFVAPYSSSEIVGAPFAKASSSAPLGTDFLGRDGLSRFLVGGGTLLVGALLATALAYLIGIPIGMAAGYRRGAIDLATVGLSDLVIAFPPIVFILVLLVGVGSGLGIVVIAIAAVYVPRIVRIVRAVTMEISTREFVEAALARGESVRSILWHDVLRNIWTPVLADFGIRLTGAVIVVSSISYLGLGPPPPAANWGLMISENRLGTLTQPWVIVVPAVTIAVFAIGVNLVADAVARSVGRSIDGRGV
jgi:peptide/nickel transport system permease protein